MTHQWLTLDITSECNLRCKHCHLWTTKEPVGSLSTSEKERVIHEFMAWKKEGRIVLAGGETLLKPEETLRLANVCGNYPGLYSILLTNGTLFTDDLLDRVILSGVSQVSFSLDAPNASSFDYSRGKQGTFESVVYWIRRMVKRKKELGRNTVVSVSVLLKRDLLGHLSEHLSFLKSLEVDGVFFVPLERTLVNTGNGDPYYDKQSLGNDPETQQSLDWILETLDHDHLVNNTREDVQLLKSMYAGKLDPEIQICGASEKSIIVDFMGNVRFCFFMEQHISEGKSLGNIREASLFEICTTENSRLYQEKMRSCKESCGLFTCNRSTVE